MKLVILVLITFTSTVHAGSTEEQFLRELRTLQQALVKKCPKQKADVDALTSADYVERATLLVRLAPCGKQSSLFHHVLALSYLMSSDLKRAEASFRDAMAFGLTESDQAGLLMALSRQDPLTDAQRADVRAHVAYFRKTTCSHADICAGVTYAAFGLDENELARSAADRAVALGFEGFQAKKRGAPAKKVDEFLARLVAP